tara:strand:+ start:1371 stop:1817 length:447 start_codon:yes stop_codon:yes gene_type:complete
VDRLLLLVLVAATAGTLAHLVQRRRPDAPVRTGWSVPQQLDRRDFDRPDAPWLVAVFTSATCDTCGSVVEVARPLESQAVAFQEVEAGERRDLHDRYAVDAVPMVLLVDGVGVVRDHHLGPVSATHLWGSLAELRQPGSTPDGCTAGS